MHTCEGCGLVHGASDDAAAVVEPAPVVEAAPGPNENDVAIAEIEAQANVATAKIYAGGADQELQLENERLRGQLAGMQQGLEAAADVAPVADPAAGAPIVVEAPPAADPPAEPGPPPVEEQPRVPKEKSSKNYFGF